MRVTLTREVTIHSFVTQITAFSEVRA